MSYTEKLKEIRKKNGLSQEQLAEELDVSRQCITKWEAGLCYPGVDNLLSVAYKFNVSLDWLFYDEISGMKGVSGIKENALYTVANRMTNPNITAAKGKYVSTGFDELDRSVGGLKRGELYLLAGPACIGKTALALAVANNISKVGNVLWFSYKDSAEDLWRKLISLSANVEYRRIDSEQEYDKESVLNAVNDLEKSNIEIVFDYDFSIEHVMEYVIDRHKNLDLLVIDSLDQLMTVRTMDKQETKRILASSIRVLVDKCSCPVLVIDGMDIEDRHNRSIDPEEMKPRHMGMFKRYWYHKWEFYRRSYYFRNSYREDGRADVEIRMSNVLWGEEKRRKTARMIFDVSTLSFEDTDINYEKAMVDIGKIFEDVVKKLKEKPVIESISFPDDLTLDITYKNYDDSLMKEIVRFAADGEIEREKKCILTKTAIDDLVGEISNEIEEQSW